MLITLVRRSREGQQNELGDNGAHRATLPFLKRTLIYLPRRYAIAKRKDCPDALFLCRENGG